MNSGIPIFPTMIPNIVNPLWFSVDEPKNEDTELIRIESIHQNWVKLRIFTKIFYKRTYLLIIIHIFFSYLH